MMQRRTFFALALSGASLLALSGCDAGPTIEFNYKLKVEVETPDGLRSGYSVLKFWGRKRSSNKLDPYAGGLGAQAHGEAVAVDLPGGQTLFALLRTEGGGDALTYLFLSFADDLRGEQDITKRLQLLQALKGQTRPLPRTETILPNGGTEVSAYPLLVMFKDTTDPITVEQVNPDDLAASFGAGNKLRTISVTVTDEPMTTGIENRLSEGFWKSWGVIHENQISRPGGIIKNPYFKSLHGTLNRNDFQTELSK